MDSNPPLPAGLVGKLVIDFKSNFLIFHMGKLILF